MYEFFKRILDIIGSLIGILLFSPVMLGVALYIKIVSPDGSILQILLLVESVLKEGNLDF